MPPGCNVRRCTPKPEVFPARSKPLCTKPGACSKERETWCGGRTGPAAAADNCRDGTGLTSMQCGPHGRGPQMAKTSATWAQLGQAIPVAEVGATQMQMQLGRPTSSTEVSALRVQLGRATSLAETSAAWVQLGKATSTAEMGAMRLQLGRATSRAEVGATREDGWWPAMHDGGRRARDATARVERRGRPRRGQRCCAAKRLQMRGPLADPNRVPAAKCARRSSRWSGRHRGRCCDRDSDDCSGSAGPRWSRRWWPR